jgi:molybdopterin converting factor small subunit
MSVSIRFSAFFADRIDGVSRVEVPATTVKDALQALDVRFPALRTLLFRPTGELNPVIVIFLNDERLPNNQLHCSIQAGDEIQIVPAIEGG